MTDPVAGLREMARVTRTSGVVVACVWDHAGERTPVAVFWRAARELGLGTQDESALPGAREGHLVELFRSSGLRQVEGSVMEARIEYSAFDVWWKPFALGVGPAGALFSTLSPDERESLRLRCETLFPKPPFTLVSSAFGPLRGIV